MKEIPVGVEVGKLCVEGLFESGGIEVGEGAKLGEAPVEPKPSLGEHVDIGLELEMLGVDEKAVEVEEKELKLVDPLHGCKDSKNPTSQTTKFPQLFNSYAVRCKAIIKEVDPTTS